MAKSKYIETLEEQYTKKDGKSVLRYKAPDNKWRYIQTDKDASGGNPMPSGGGMVEVKWQELKDKRDNGELTAGTLYRITDYNCTTTQENTQSAGHQFDIVLLALSENKLAEEGWTMEHPTDVYDVTFYDEVTKKCYIYKYNRDGEILANVIITDNNLGIEALPVDGRSFSIDETNKTAVCAYDSTSLTSPNLQYSYFQNSNLSAWKVWYCLDNDTARFAWADDRVETVQAYITTTGAETMYHRDVERDRDGYFAWYGRGGFTYYTSSETPSVGDNVYYVNSNKLVLSGESVASYTPEEILGYYGRGVIYRLIDEWNNDVGYDFKNIQYIRPMTDGDYDPDNGEDTWVYTFSKVVDAVEDGSLQKQCNQNYIQSITYTGELELPNNVLFTGYSEEDDMYCINNSIKRDSSGNTLLYGCSVIELIMCNNCVIDEGMYQMTIHWGNEKGEFGEGDGWLYVLNKKVLIEE